MRKIDHLGWIVIPRETRRVLEIEKKDWVEIFVEGESIILQKYQGDDVCPITGEVSFQHIKLGDGKLTLSPGGAKQLIQELEPYLVREPKKKGEEIVGKKPTSTTGEKNKRYGILSGTSTTRSSTKKKEHDNDFSKWISYQRNNNRV